MTEPSGARLPRGKVTVLVRPALRGSFGAHDHVVGIDAVARASNVAQPLAPLALLPPVEHLPERLAGDGQARVIEQAQLPQVQHDFGHAAGEEDADGRMADRAVGQDIDQARHLAIDAVPVVDASAGAGRRQKAMAGMCSSRFVEPPNAAWTVMRSGWRRR